MKGINSTKMREVLVRKRLTVKGILKSMGRDRCRQYWKEKQLMMKEINNTKHEGNTDFKKKKHETEASNRTGRKYDV